MMDRDHKKYRCTDWLDSNHKYGEQTADVILRYSQMKDGSYDKK